MFLAGPIYFPVLWVMLRKLSAGLICNTHNTCYLLLHSAFINMSLEVHGCVSRGAVYLCSTSFTVATGYNLFADNGTIFCLYLSRTLLANALFILTAAWGKYHPEVKLSVAFRMRLWVCTSYISGKFVCHTIRSKCCMSFMCSELCMRYGRP